MKCHPAGIRLKTRCVTHLTAAAGTNQESLEILTLCEAEWVSNQLHADLKLHSL